MNLLGNNHTIDHIMRQAADLSSCMALNVNAPVLGRSSSPSQKHDTMAVASVGQRFPLTLQGFSCV